MACGGLAAIYDTLVELEEELGDLPCSRGIQATGENE
jgi:hypothetical protein